MDNLKWRKATYSSTNGGACVEVGETARSVAVRDTKQNGTGDVLTFTPAEWQKFTRKLKKP
jgi:hypothetical protein